MAQQMLSAIDENTISVSLDFVLEEETTACGERKGVLYRLDLLTEWDITLNDFLHGAFRGLQADAGIPAGQGLSAVQLTEFSEEQLAAFLDGLAPARTDSREPAQEICPAGAPLDTQPEANACKAGLAVMAQTLRDFYRTEQLPADRAAELAAEPFGRPQPVHINAGYVKEGGITDAAHAAAVSDGAQLWLTAAAHGKMTLRELGLLSGSSIEFHLGKSAEVPYIVVGSALNPAFAAAFPLYKISETPVYVFDGETVTVNPAGEPPKKAGGTLLALLSPLVMTVVMLLVRVSGSGASALTYGLMGAATLLMAVVNLIARGAAFRRQLTEWKTHYEAYITRTVHHIQNRKKQDENILNELYPPVCGAPLPPAAPVWKKKGGDAPEAGSLMKKTAELSGEIFSRGMTHPCFLHVRIGTTVPGSQLVENPLQVKGAETNPVFTAVGYRNPEADAKAPFRIVMPESGGRRDGYLTDLPAAIAARYRWLDDNAPVHVDLRTSSCLGVVMPEPLSFTPFITELVFQLAFYHSPEDVQFVYLSAAKGYAAQQQRIALFRHLPHFHELFANGLRQTAFCAGEAAPVMDQLVSLLEARRNSPESFPHVVVLVEDEFHFANHPLSKWLPRPPKDDKTPENDGVSFIFCKRYAEHLPAYCQQTVLARQEAQTARWYLVPHVRQLGDNAPVGYDPALKPYTLEAAQERYAFCPDRTPPAAELAEGFRMLSSLYIMRVAQSASIPKSVSLYDILEIFPTAEELAAASDEKALRSLMEDKLEACIRANWGQHDADATLQAPIGLRAPMAAQHDEKALVMLDLKQGGDGVHAAIAGTTGSGKSELIIAWLLCLCLLYDPSQLNICLLDLKGGGFSERLAGLPHCVGTVDNLASDRGESPLYLLSRFEQAIKAEIVRREKAFNEWQAKDIEAYNCTVQQRCAAADGDEGAELPQRMPYLLIVVDEFAELLRISGDSDVNFRQLIDALARTGRSLGMHLVMASQNVTGSMSDETRTNTHVYLCLKVNDFGVSRSMIGSDDAAKPTMPGHGRCFLRTVNGRFDAFQGTYTGASWRPGVKDPVRLTRVPRAGLQTAFYDSSDESAAGAERKDTTQLQLAVEAACRVFEKAVSENKLQKPQKVCVSPLPAVLPFGYDETIPSEKESDK